MKYLTKKVDVVWDSIILKNILMGLSLDDILGTQLDLALLSLHFNRFIIKTIKILSCVFKH